MSKIIQKTKFMHLLYVRNLCCQLKFHTSRNMVLPNMARGENYNEPEYANCFKPAKLPVTDMPCLAGEPRNIAPPTQGITPEIYERWNQIPQKNLPREMAKLCVYY